MPTVAVWTWSEEVTTVKEGTSAFKAVISAGAVDVDDYFAYTAPVTPGEEYDAGVWVKVVSLGSGHCYFQVWDVTNAAQIGKTKMTATTTLFVFLPLKFTVPRTPLPCASIELRLGGEAQNAEFIFDALTCVRFRAKAVA